MYDIDPSTLKTIMLQILYKTNMQSAASNEINKQINKQST